MFAASKTKQAASAAATDPYFPYVPLLLETTSTNGQQNNTFLDSSASPNTLTRTGTPTQGSVTPYWPNGQWSNYFSSSYLSVADSSSLRFGSANFTIEAWVYRTASGATHTIACKGSSTGPTGWVFQISSGDKLVFIDTSTSITGTTSLAANTWYYVAVVRAGTGSNQTTLYVNGVSDGTGTSATTFSQTNAMRIGADRSAANGFSGYVSNLRLSNTNLTISSTPTTPLTALGSTIFLSCGYNRFFDGSTLASAITVGSGTPTVQAFQPFSPTASYTTALYGGSGYFNGSTDYLSTASSSAFTFGTADFTVEYWVYCPSLPGPFTILCGGNLSSATDIGFGFNPSSPYCTHSANWPVYTTTPMPTNAWTHLAFTRTSGTWKLYMNGVDVTTASQSNPNVTTATLGIGATSSGGSKFIGSICNLRVVKGVAVYTGAFTPPTLAPLTTAGSTSAASYPSTTNVNTTFAASSTSLLTNFTNAGVYDAAVQNNQVTVGDAQASTTQYKWSPTSMKFDGTGDYLSILSNPALNFGSGSFTVEAWVYLSAQSGDYFVISATGSGGAFFGFNNGTAIGYGRSAVAWDYTIASGVSTGAWYHLAWSRNGTSMRIFVNGTQVGTTQTTSQAYDLTTTSTTVGSQGANFYLNGYIQDLRITSGIGRYTANFSVPTAAFPTR